MKRTIFLAVVVCGLMFIFNMTASAQQVYVASLSGSQEVPAVNSPGRGFCKIIINAAQTQISVSCTYSGLTSNVTGSHIHGNGVVGVNAPILFDFNFTGGQSGTIGATPLTFSVTSAQLADMRANRWYINIHTTNFGGGEIRGQIRRAHASTDDYDGDGRSDPTVYRSSNNTFYSLLSVTNSLRAQQWGQFGDQTAFNYDLDGDGLGDYVVARIDLATGAVTAHILRSTTNSIRSVPFGNLSFGDQLGAGDFDGDGIFDIGAFRNGLWSYIESSTGATRGFQWGQAGDIPLPADYDGDGKWDFAVIRLINNQYRWFIYQTSNGQLRNILFGNTGDSFFQGDVDADGKADPVIFRIINGFNYIYTFRSSDGVIQQVQWGTSGDRIRYGDYDGDGKSDPVAIRDINGSLYWFILQSSNNQIRTLQWGTSGDF